MGARSANHNRVGCNLCCSSRIATRATPSPRRIRVLLLLPLLLLLLLLLLLSRRGIVQESRGAKMSHTAGAVTPKFPQCASLFFCLHRRSGGVSIVWTLQFVDGTPIAARITLRTINSNSTSVQLYSTTKRLPGIRLMLVVIIMSRKEARWQKPDARITAVETIIKEGRNNML